MRFHHVHNRRTRTIRPLDAERLVARVRATSLDRQLAEGLPPEHSAAHAARAAQLGSARTRATLARSLERLVEQADQPPVRPRSIVIAPCRPQVWEARPILLMMAFRLRAGGPVGTCGLARLKLLLSDGVGPCYAAIGPYALVVELQAVSRLLDALDTGAPCRTDPS